MRICECLTLPHFWWCYPVFLGRTAEVWLQALGQRPHTFFPETGVRLLEGKHLPLTIEGAMESHASLCSYPGEAATAGWGSQSRKPPSARRQVGSKKSRDLRKCVGYNWASSGYGIEVGFKSEINIYWRSTVYQALCEVCFFLIFTV